MKTIRFVTIRRLFIVLAVGLITATGTLLALAATQTDIVGPLGSESFGQQVVVLANGNIVVTDPFYDASDSITDTGAVYLYNGATGALISRVTGGQAHDQVGSGGVVTLTNGNYVVRSPLWSNGAATEAGAVTWGNGTSGITGVVSVTNSLVGSTTSDLVGSSVVALSNGNYVVRSPWWDNGTMENAGAATWGNGTTGITGVVSITNSLVGSTAGDWISEFYGDVTVLSNGNYVVSNPSWDNGTAANVGAATWGNGATGITGVASITNSLVGSTAEDQVGIVVLGGDYRGVTGLTNGNYVVLSVEWHNDMGAGVGAATWGNGMTGITGAVSVTNSLVGNTAGDFSGYFVNVTALHNGNYVVSTPLWNNGSATDTGAVTWGNGTTGITGVISITNSLVGSTAGDFDGYFVNVTALDNGNYVVSNPVWDNGVATDAGAVTWGNGTTGITGVVSVTNSLVGNTMDDMIGYGIFDDYNSITVLNNGNYVVSSPDWDNGATANAGAATWGNGTTGITGVVSIANSLVGSTANDRISWSDVTALSNGNYVVSSPYWDNGTVVNVGAATWGNGATGTTGVVSITNSLVGSTAGDFVGYDYSGDDSVTALSNGNYVVSSPFWGNGAATDAGAVTWGNGTLGITGVVSITNSLVGSTAEDSIGYNGYGGSQIIALSNGNYVVNSSLWDNGIITDAGAVTWANGATGITGVLSITNSLVGNTVDDRIGWEDYSGKGGVTGLSNGNYVVHSPLWNNDMATIVGAVTLGDGQSGTVGLITADNSVRGSTAGGGWNLNFDYDYTHHQLVVGRPADNIVTLLRSISYQVYLPLVIK